MLDQSACTAIVAQYMQGQGWGLVSPQELAAQIWGEIDPQTLTPQSTLSHIQNLAWQKYAALLHHRCHTSDHPQHDAAWEELKAWLARQVRRFDDPPQEQQDLVQETLIELAKQPLRAPRTLWAFALKTMENKRIDRHRRNTAIKHGGGTILSLEDLGETPEFIPDHPDNPRQTETTVEKHLIRRQIERFFQQHLPTDLQRQVAIAHFLDGLRPKQIAGLMGKPPHQIRLVKARVVQTLRSLPAQQQRELLEMFRGMDAQGEEHA